VKSHVATRKRSFLVLLLTIAVLLVPTAGSAAQLRPKSATAEPGTKIASRGQGTIIPMGRARLSKMPGIKKGIKPHVRKFGTLRINGKASPVFRHRDLGAKSGKVSGRVSSPKVATPTNIRADFTGTTDGTSSCFCQPPDPNGAVNWAYIVEAVNLALGIYARGGGLVSRTGLNTFFNTTDSLSDPRVFFDSTWNRWVLTVIPVPAATTSTPAEYFAVSTTANPTGGWWRYRITFGGSLYPAGTLLDYPMVGMDSDAVIISTNNYQLTGSGFSYINSAVFALPKQRTYNGQGFSFPAFGVDYSTHPAFVGGIPQDNTSRTYLASSLLSGYNLQYFDVYYLTNTAKPDATALTFYGNTSATGPSGSRPNAITQPGGGQLDALDGRLQAAPWQLGDRLWFARAVGFPVVQYGYITLSTLAVTAAVAYKAGPSQDWNPAIGVIQNGLVFLNWDYVDASVPTQVTMRVSGLGAADPVQNLIGIGTDVETGFHGSNTRFGDFSSVSIDYWDTGSCAGKAALIVNELFGSNNDWVARLARVGFC